MRIGQLSERTSTSRRLLRYYEEQRLISSTRSPNGYRDYTDSCVDKVIQIRQLLEAGLPTRVIRELLPCVDNDYTIAISQPTRETIDLLETERMRMGQRIDCLTRNRQAITRYLESVKAAAAE